MLKKPEDVRQFASDHFLHPELPGKIREQVARIPESSGDGAPKCPFLSSSSVSTNEQPSIDESSANEDEDCSESGTSSGDSV